jgi:hypothetical protein
MPPRPLGVFLADSRCALAQALNGTFFQHVAVGAEVVE